MNSLLAIVIISIHTMKVNEPMYVTDFMQSALQTSPDHNRPVSPDSDPGRPSHRSGSRVSVRFNGVGAAPGGQAKNPSICS